jgi:hypothetical protein
VAVSVAENMLLLAVTTEQADDGSNGGLHDLQAIAEAELDMRVRELTPVFFRKHRQRNRSHGATFILVWVFLTGAVLVLYSYRSWLDMREKGNSRAIY